jgi:sugar fermentation stimulation protein A
VLQKRYKRFLADLELAGGQSLTVHCPNTGSMRNCNLPGSAVLYSDSGNDKRKYRHTLEAVRTPSGAWAGINTARANHLVREALEQGRLQQAQGYACIRREVPYGEDRTGRPRSRIDLLLEGHPEQADCYLEVKNVTLEQDGERVMFPDAVTERGTRHLQELMKVCAEGYRAMLCFCVQHSTAKYFEPAADIDPVYAQHLLEARQTGVEIVAYGAEITAESICLNRPIDCRF